MSDYLLQGIAELEEKVKQLDDEKRILMEQVEGLIKQSAIKEAAKDYLSAKNLALVEYIETIEATCKELEKDNQRLRKKIRKHGFASKSKLNTGRSDTDLRA